MFQYTDRESCSSVKFCTVPSIRWKFSSLRQVSIGLFVALLVIVAVSYVRDIIENQVLSQHACKLEAELRASGVSNVSVRTVNRKLVGLIIEGNARSDVEYAAIREVGIDYPVVVQLSVAVNGIIKEELLTGRSKVEPIVNSLEESSGK